LNRRSTIVSFVTVGEENSSKIELYYEDLGAGSPVILLAGYPLTGTAWEKQIPALIAAGHRVITLDRRGFGRSSRPSVGYDFDTLAGDLDALVNHLRLTEVSLVGWSMGTGEIIRYIGKYGVSRVRKIALLGTMGPFWLKTADNPDGAEAGMFEGFQTAMRADRPATMLNIIKNARNHDVLGGTLVSDEAINEAWNVAVTASPIAAVECLGAWMTDFGADVPKITVPTLIVHAGDTDRVLPPDISSRKLVKLISGARLVEIEGGPHDILWTHPDEVNEALVAFLR
jgi:pimeloyl-ACP methyl ester carboxylesterase